MARWKTIETKFKNFAKNITYDETVSLLEHYGYIQHNKGRTSGSRVCFTCKGHCDILLHRPHPGRELKMYVVRDLHNLFEQEGFWDE